MSTLLSELSRELEAEVKRIEARSSAEVVVVLAARSDTYREVAWATAGVAAWLALAFLAWAPPSFDGAWFPIDVLLVGVVAGLLARRAPGLAARVVPATIRRARVRAAAEAAFYAEAVHATRARTGILYYVSVLEREVVILADQGVLGRVPPATLASLRPDGSRPEGVVAGLRSLDDLLALHLPAEGDNADEIPDAPRVRP